MKGRFSQEGGIRKKTIEGQQRKDTLQSILSLSFKACIVDLFDNCVVEQDEELEKSNQYAFVQFHPSYDYTDFVEGLRPKSDGNNNIGFELKDGIFKAFCYMCSDCCHY